MNYDDFGRITQLTSPDTGTHTYSYDTVNRRDTHTDAKGIVHTTTSDLNGNPVTITHTGSGVTQTENYTYNNNNSLMTINDNSGSTTIVRNNLDQITKKTVVIGGKTLVVQYGYNTIGQLTSMTYPSGLIINYGYTNGFLTSISSSGNNIVNNISYNSMLKEPVSWVLGGSIVTIDKDTDGLLTGFVDSGTFNQTITTDNMGHVLSLIDSSSNDDFNVMLTPNYEVQSGTMNGKNLYYNIGPNHNLYVQNDGITNINYNPNYYHNKIASLNDNISGSSYSLQYDNNGNTVSDNKGTYTYDLKNNMISSSRTINGVSSTGIYTFNALSQRVAKNVGGQFRYFVYNETNQVVGEYDNNGNVIQEYVYFGLRPVAVKNNGSLNIVHSDYLGTPRMVSSGLNGGSMLWQWKNDNPYGYNEANGSIEFNLRFAGQYYDSESGLHYNMFRTYNPEIGRYMQSDPIGLAGGFNTYNYVGRNPLNGVDPLGLESVEYYLDLWISSSKDWGLALNLAREGKMHPLKDKCGNEDKNDADNRTAAEHYISVRYMRSEGGIVGKANALTGWLWSTGYYDAKYFGIWQLFKKTSPASLTQYNWGNYAWWDSFDNTQNKYYTQPKFSTDYKSYSNLMDYYTSLQKGKNK